MERRGREEAYLATDAGETERVRERMSVNGKEIRCVRVSACVNVCGERRWREKKKKRPPTNAFTFVRRVPSLAKDARKGIANAPLILGAMTTAGEEEKSGCLKRRERKSSREPRKCVCSRLGRSTAMTLWGESVSVYVSA